MEKISDIASKRKDLFAKCLYHSFQTPLVIDSAKGQYYFNENGQYLDLYNNVSHIGHSNQRILQTVTQQYSKVNINTRYFNNNLTTYAEHLSQYLPKGNKYKILFVNSGSQANDLALRIVLNAKPNKKIMGMQYSYHGTSYLCVKSSHLYSNGLPKKEYDQNMVLFEKRNSLETMKTNISNIAGLIIECIQGVGGNYDFSDQYLQEMFKLAKSNGLITICDEVQTGFGRSGHSFWAFEHSKLDPDIFTCGKPIANGYPMGAIIFKQELEQYIDEFYFNTYGGNSVACAVAKTTLEEIQNLNLIENSKCLGEYLKENLRRIPQISNISGRGLYIGFNIENASHIVNELYKNKIVVGIGANHTVRIKPPIIVNRENIDHFIRTLLEIISKLDIVNSQQKNEIQQQEEIDEEESPSKQKKIKKSHSKK